MSGKRTGERAPRPGLTSGNGRGSCLPADAAVSGHCYWTRSGFFVSYAFGSGSAHGNCPGCLALRSGTFEGEASGSEGKAEIVGTTSPEGGLLRRG